MVDGEGGTDEKRGNDGSRYVYHPPIGTCSTAELAFLVADKKVYRAENFNRIRFGPKKQP
jgi:hypothetical protein